MKVFITGIAGFIGICAAKRLSEEGNEVIGIDNLSRPGSEHNISLLLGKTSSIEFIEGDIRDENTIDDIFSKRKFDLVLHLAGQVAVTNSLKNPRRDLEDNIIGTFNILEALRKTNSDAMLIFSSTNKVYGELSDLQTSEEQKRYCFKSVRSISEERRLDFHSPYGCSKGAADQYVIDYSRCFGLKTSSFRQSCIYGYNQFGLEDQGWVAHFTISAYFDREIKIYGNGKQVRDVLFIDDLISAYEMAYKNVDRVVGKAYNIGGGDKFTLSLLELIEMLEKKLGRKIKYSFHKERMGDQKVYISDIQRAKADFYWEPQINPEKGLNKLLEWVEANREVIKKVLNL